MNEREREREREKSQKGLRTCALMVKAHGPLSMHTIRHPLAGQAERIAYFTTIT